MALETATVQRSKDSGDKAADAVLRCLKTLSTQLSSCQIGITITTLLTGYLSIPPSGAHHRVINSMGLPSSVTDMLTLLLAMLVTNPAVHDWRVVPEASPFLPSPWHAELPPHSWHSPGSCPHSCAS